MTAREDSTPSAPSPVIPKQRPNDPYALILGLVRRAQTEVLLYAGRPEIEEAELERLRKAYEATKVVIATLSEGRNR